MMELESVNKDQRLLGYVQLPLHKKFEGELKLKAREKNSPEVVLASSLVVIYTPKLEPSTVLDEVCPEHVILRELTFKL
jgi:hypothetical protein